jgi:hypothetical protein
MEGMKLDQLELDFDNNKGDLQSASRSGQFVNFQMNFNSFGGGHSMGPVMGIPTGSLDEYFKCPIDVPFCERQACVNPSFDNLGTSQNAFACYSQPGCCFDQTLFQYRVAFGEKFYQSVPVCYRAIDNQLFSQLAQQMSMNGQFQPAFVQPVVDQVQKLMANPYMSLQVRTFQGCSARHGTPEQYNFIQRVGGGNYMVMSFVTDEQKYNDFISTLSQSCGWSGINADECVLRGCCWNDASNSCENPLGEVTPDRVQNAIQYMTYKEAFGKDNTQKSGPQIPSFPSVPFSGGAPPMFGSEPSPGGAAPPFGRRKRRSFNNLLGMMGMGNMGQMGNMGPMGNMGLMPNMAMGGMPGGLFTNPTLGEKEVCPATNIARNCMVPSTINQNDMMQKMLLERHCKAKNCCWDNDRYQKSLMMSAGGGNGASESFFCPWAVKDFSMYNMPSLAYSLRGCCDYSPCVERTGRDGTHIPGVQKQPRGPIGPITPGWTPWGAWTECNPSCGSGTQQRVRQCPGGACEGAETEEQDCFTNCDPIVWSNWNSYGCSRTCGGGYEILYRTCVSGPCPQQQEIKHNQPCNTDVPCGWQTNFNTGNNWFNSIG